VSALHRAVAYLTCPVCAMDCRAHFPGREKVAGPWDDGPLSRGVYPARELCRPEQNAEARTSPWTADHGPVLTSSPLVGTSLLRREYTDSA
jgi:hypothetical protein